jgi:hypothetical protein
MQGVEVIESEREEGDKVRLERCLIQQLVKEKAVRRAKGLVRVEKEAKVKAPGERHGELQRRKDGLGWAMQWGLRLMERD